MSKFYLEKKEFPEREVAVIFVNGYLDSKAFDKFTDFIDEIARGGIVRIVINMKDLNYISSAGLATILGEIKELRELGGDLKICQMSPKIKNLFDMLGFSRLVQIFEKQEEAINKFEEEKKKMDDY